MTAVNRRVFQRLVVALCLVCHASLDVRPSAALGQQPAASHVTIPFLANATKPMDLDFEGGECDVAPTGRTMTCQFQQVILTASPLNTDTCLVTTNRYERTFQQESNTRWVSKEGPEGVCGVVDVETLQDDGGVRWTMDARKEITKREAAECRGPVEAPEVLSWQNLRRPLPCRFVQPGAIAR